MQVTIESSAYKRCEKRKRIEEVYVSGTYAYDPNLFNLLKLPPHILARQITLFDVKRFKAIREGELLSRGWEKKDAEKLRMCPNIYKFTTQFNQVSYWVAGEILQENTPKSRADKISYFLKIAKCLEDLQNYHSLMAVVLGMNVNAIFRLHKTWEAVHKRDKSEFETYVDLTSRNWEGLRERFTRITPPAVPHLGVYLQQISGLHSHPKLSNLDKTDKTQLLIESLHKFQHSQFDILHVDHIQDFLSSEKYILEMQRFMEDNINKKSLECEPNAPSTTPPSSLPFSRVHKASRSLEDITLVNPLHCDLERTPSQRAAKPAWKPGHRKTNSLSVLEGFNSDQEKAGTAFLLDSPTSEGGLLKETVDQNLIDDSWRRNRSVSEPPETLLQQRSITFGSLGQINEVRVEGVLLKKTCQKLGKQPKLRRWKAFYCLVSDGTLSLYLVKGHKSAGGIGQSSTLKKSILLDACTVTLSPDLKYTDVFTIADTVGNIYKFKGNAELTADDWVEKINEEKRHKGDLIGWQ